MTLALPVTCIHAAVPCTLTWLIKCARWPLGSCFHSIPFPVYLLIWQQVTAQRRVAHVLFRSGMTKEWQIDPDIDNLNTNIGIGKI